MSTNIITGDVREMLTTIPPRSVQCVVTSPPYYGLRDYGVAGQIGLEPTLAGYITGMVEVFRLVRDVLADDGTVWLNIGDSYAANRGNGASGMGPKQASDPGSLLGRLRVTDGLKEKDLMMVPARLAIALQDDGWYLRSDIIWHKPNPMPESVTDRPTSAHEHIFLLTKSPRYYYDADAIREPSERPDLIGKQRLSGVLGLSQDDLPSQDRMRRDVGRQHDYCNPAGRNCRNVWSIATAPYSGAHFATFPPEIPRRCILAGTSEKGQCPACGKPWVRVTERTPMEINRTDWGEQAGTRTAASGTMTKAPTSTTIGWQPSCPCDAGDPVPQTVLDIFAGAGTTLMVADRLGRNAIGIELNPEYATLARNRIYNDAPLLAGAAD